MDVVVLGLSLTSAWGNGHASTYRSLLGALGARGHSILFLERDVPWYREHRDLVSAPYADVEFYDSLGALDEHFAATLGDADLVVVGSYVPEGTAVIDLVLKRARGVIAFYDIDTPITLEALSHGDAAYLRADQIPAFDLYLSFAGGPSLELLEDRFGARRARPLYCAVDTDLYHLVERAEARWDLGYLGTFSEDRAEGLDHRLLEPARRWPQGRFVVAGAQFPADLGWPANVEHREHVAPTAHAAFFAAQRFTLNLTREAMRRAGYSPSVRLFEAAACGVPIISDPWPGLSSVFTPGTEILVTTGADDTLAYLMELSEGERHRLADRARARVLSEHTAGHRASAVEDYVAECGADAAVRAC